MVLKNICHRFTRGKHLNNSFMKGTIYFRNNAIMHGFHGQDTTYILVAFSQFIHHWHVHGEKKMEF